MMTDRPDPASRLGAPARIGASGTPSLFYELPIVPDQPVVRLGALFVSLMPKRRLSLSRHDRYCPDAKLPPAMASATDRNSAAGAC
jgi:hypothetical protein